MKRKMLCIFVLIFTFIVFGVSGNFAQEKTVKTEKEMTAGKDALQKKVTSEFKNHCAVSGCHRGQFPKKKLNLEPDKFYDAMVDVPSLQIDSLKLVDTKSPEKSYLLMKIKGEKGIIGDRMPIEAPPLKPDEIEIIEKWIQSLKASETGEKALEKLNTGKKRIEK